MPKKTKTAWVLSVRYAGEEGDPWNIFSSFDYYHSFLQAIAMTAFNGSMTAASQLDLDGRRDAADAGRDDDALDALNSRLAGKLRIEKMEPMGFTFTKLDEASKGDMYFLHPEDVLVESDAEAAYRRALPA